MSADKQQERKELVNAFNIYRKHWPISPEFPLQSKVHAYMVFIVEPSYESTEKWAQLRGMCKGYTDGISTIASNNSVEEFTRKWLDSCELSSNRELPVLERTECGVGKGIGTKYKELRYYGFAFELPRDNNKITFEAIVNGDDEGEQWTLDQIHDLIKSFEKLCNSYMADDEYTDDEYVYGYLKLK